MSISVNLTRLVVSNKLPPAPVAAPLPAPPKMITGSAPSTIVSLSPAAVQIAKATVGGDGTDTIHLAGVAADWKVGGAALAATSKPATLNYGSATSLTLTNTKTKAVLTVTSIEKYDFFNDIKLSSMHA